MEPTIDVMTTKGWQTIEAHLPVAAAVEDKTASCELTQQPVTADRAFGKVIDLAELLARSLAKTEPNGDRNRAVAQAEPATGAPRRVPARAAWWG
jgi:non-homologous end joining protein Ku